MRPIGVVQRTGQLDQAFGETTFRFGRDERANSCGSRGADLTPLVALVPGTLHRVVERIFRRRGGDVAGRSIVDDLGVAADVGHDRHAAGQHRFDQHDRQPLAARRQDQAVVTAPDRGDVAHEAREGHVGEAQVARHPLETGALQTVAVERDRERPIAPLPARQNPQQKILALLLWVQASDAGQSPFIPIIRPVRARFPRHEKRIAHHRRERRRKSELFLGQPAVVFGDEKAGLRRAVHRGNGFLLPVCWPIEFARLLRHDHIR